MIFRQWEKVLPGEKTQTRRAWRCGDYGWVCGELIRPNRARPILLYSSIYTAADRQRYAIDQLLPIIPKRGQRAIRDDMGNIQRVRIMQLWRESLQDITEADALLEGVASVEEYQALWMAINGKTKGLRWEDNPLVTVITFKLEIATVPLSDVLSVA